ncbi:AI-2E family transporter [Flavobacterium salilacus subsp. salilacus]|uniref:AI-2E family transporter n=1 Tax=Flavobacterium TaxID=237 RepID=UPI00107548B0|nr:MULTISPECIES: AI-2E family transporter [Flavobacterium]KAF2519232.1 AI-2E family transporter [Flavobacterium salilacus subsp. salilacus]MBE1613414.1 AI-2E family transporter [Flavobacterium sp. SaA2.13]
MITSKVIANGILRALAVIVAVFILVMFLYKIQSVLIYLFIALIVSMIASPVIRFLKTKLKFPHVVAVVTTLFLFICLMAGFIMLFVPLIITQGENLSLLDTAKLEQDVTDLIAQVNGYFSDYDINTEQLVKEADLTSKLNFNFIPDFINSLLNILSGFGIGLGSVLFITFFFLKDQKAMDTGFRKLISDAHEEKILNSLRKIDNLLSRYFIGLILQITVLFILYLIVLLIFGVQNAVIIAFLTALLNIIPYIGPLIATVLVIVLTMLGLMGPETQGEMLSTTLYVVIGYSIAQIIDNNVSTPLIFSNSVKSHPLEIFLVILASGFVFGILGMIIAVPLYTAIKVVAKEFFPQNTIVRMLTKDL